MEQMTQDRAHGLGRCFYSLFLLVVPTAVADLMTGNAARIHFPGLVLPGEVLVMLAQLLYGGILLRMRRADVRYRTAGLCLLVSAAATFLTESMQILHPTPYLIFPAILGVVLDVCGIYCEYHAHSTVVSEFDGDYARKWHHLWYWFIGTYVAMVLSIGWMSAAPKAGTLCFYGTALAAAIVVIMKFVYLLRTARMLKAV